MEKTAQGSAESPAPRTSRHIFWWGLLMALLAIGAWVAFIVFSEEFRPSITLPNGVIVTYHGSSRGVATKSRYSDVTYKHEAPPPGSRFQRLWKVMYDNLPKPIASHIKAPTLLDVFPNHMVKDELEVRLQFEGGFVDSEWDIGVADENGWETIALGYLAPPSSGWIRVCGAFPRHSRTLRLRFHPSTQKDPSLTEKERRAEFTELTIKNPFYEASLPAPAASAPPPITKPFRDGTITLRKLARETSVGAGYGLLQAEFALERDGRAIAGYEWEIDITDSSGQVFRQASRRGDFRDGDAYLATAYTAPWSDNPCWRIRLSLNRRRGSEDVKEEELFHFENLPVPSRQTMKLNRSITRNGVTLTITNLSPLQSGQAFFTVTGWTQGDPLRRIVIKDARDDQGRTEVSTSVGGSALLVGSSSSYGPTGPTFSLRLAPDAKSWEVTLVPETITIVDFQVQPPLVK